LTLTVKIIIYAGIMLILAAALTALFMRDKRKYKNTEEEK